jgi:integrase
MATHQFNFTEKSLDSWVQRLFSEWQEAPTNVPTTGEAWSQDRGGPKSVPGLHLRIRLRKDGVGGWTLRDPGIGFYLLKKVHGRKFTRELGGRRVVSVTSAREAATRLLKSLAKGEDPREAERKKREIQKLQKLTLRQALEDLLADGRAFTEGTRKKYRQALSTTFKDVADKPLTYFTEKRVRELHQKRSEESRSRADQDFRVLRLVWNWARNSLQTEAGEPVLGPNPVSLALDKSNRRAGTRGWNHVPRRESIVPRASLPGWLQTLHAIREDPTSSPTRKVSALFLEVLILTGLRFNELARLPWARVDLARGVLTVPDTTSKNRR